MLLMCLMLSFFGRIESLSVTVNDVECVYEYVLYEGDTVSGNFVVVDHDIFWGSDHPGLDLTVSTNAYSVMGAFDSFLILLNGVFMGSLQSNYLLIYE